ncbi:hypothetical protein ABW20_dc0102074 [Dactylellina cionopaga]|nr:hypothetical protein ABW20_dc0102074 [Dactylellina cionopaga]
MDALLESISGPKASLGKPSGIIGLAKRTLRNDTEDEAGDQIDEDDESANVFVNLENTEQPWQKNAGRLYHILRLENCGRTMIRSDIERIFSNHDALLKGWRIDGNDILHIVQARSPRLESKSRYYVYFHSSKAARHHLKYFVGFRDPETKIDWTAITLPPPAASQTAKELERASSSPYKRNSAGGPTAVQRWAPRLAAVNHRKMPFTGVTPNLLYENNGAPGRSVLVCLCANSHWQYLQVWLRYSLLERYGFGKWLVAGGDCEGYGLERISQSAPGTKEPYLGGRWVIRFREGYESEGERLVREWDARWVSIQGNWTRMKAELLW